MSTISAIVPSGEQNLTVLETGFESRTPPFTSIFSIKLCRSLTSMPK
jgi:hypothetical protein